MNTTATIADADHQTAATVAAPAVNTARKPSAKTAKTSTAYRPTGYKGVRQRGLVHYFVVKTADGKWKEEKYGEGTAKDAYKARITRQEQEDRKRNGISDPAEEAIAKQVVRPIAEIVDEFKAHLQGKNDSRFHVADTIRCIERIIRECSFNRVIDIDPHRVNRWIAELDLSARSKNAYRAAVLSFTRWAFDYGRAPRNPLSSRLVHRYNEKTDPRRPSRALTQEESQKLFAALINKDRMLGEREKGDRLLAQARERRAFYLLAANTGLRWREVARLTWADVRLDRAEVVIPDQKTKTKKGATLPLIPEVVDALAELRPSLMMHGAVQTAQQKIFSNVPTHATWKHDLIRAGIVKAAGKLTGVPQNKDLIGFIDDRGRRLDRKCLRMSFCTWLHQKGVDVRTAQALMRHSDINLTTRIYTDLGQSDLRTAVGKLSPSAPAALTATPTTAAKDEPAPAVAG
ncbi:MAG: tyrosine-type recombinase/integrase [Phycisphaeraceae bacterium]|nr:tyrosine-type recombinase/integrase [Phycisphaeraceae bacterium]